MMYLGKTPVYSFGTSPVGETRVVMSGPDVSGSLYVKNACLLARASSQTGTARNVWMDRLYDWVNYENLPINSAPPPSGFEVETTIILNKEEQPAYCAIWGLRNGSTPITRANVMFKAKQGASQGLSVEPADNIEYLFKIRGKKIHVRMICVPKYNDGPYIHNWSSRLIIEDVDKGTTLLDETETFGDNENTDVLMSNITTFYRFHSGWFARNTYANPSSNYPKGNEFDGYFFGGAVYLNPTGADTRIPTRIPIQILTPVKQGQTYTIKMPGYYSGEQIIPSTGVAVEIIDIETLLSSGLVEGRFFRMMENCSQFTEAVFEYQD